MMRILLLSLAFLSARGAALAQDEPRFPQPDFTSGYTIPEPTTPLPRSLPLEYLDVIVLAAVLGLATWYALRGRSRRGVFLLTILSVLYFGFWRNGCVCAVGASQNVVQALTPAGVVLPVTVTVFFLLPLAVTLFAGRTFCSGVCPLGAIQDLVVMRPLKIPAPLSRGLGLMAYLYLGLVVLFAATGAGYLLCRYDPFVGFFRLSGRAGMIYTGAAFLLGGMVLARPYCRFLCPYGVLLKWTSHFSARHLTITPDKCVQCRMCEDSCPFGAIRFPVDPPSEMVLEAFGKRRRRLAILLPAILAAGMAIGWSVSEPLARAHPTVTLAREVRQDQAIPGGSGEGSLQLAAFLESARPAADLFEEEARHKRRFAFGGTLLGGFMGLAVWGNLLSLAFVRAREDYVPDRGGCFSCGRCLRTCPVEHVRRHGSEADLQAFVEKVRAKGWGGAATEATAPELARLVQEGMTPGEEPEGGGKTS